MAQQEITSRRRKEPNDAFEYQSHETFLDCAEHSMRSIMQGFTELFVMVDGEELTPEKFTEKVKIEIDDKLN